MHYDYHTVESYVLLADYFCRCWFLLSHPLRSSDPTCAILLSRRLCATPSAIAISMDVIVRKMNMNKYKCSAKPLGWCLGANVCWWMVKRPGPQWILIQMSDVGMMSEFASVSTAIPNAWPSINVCAQIPTKRFSVTLHLYLFIFISRHILT